MWKEVKVIISRHNRNNLYDKLVTVWITFPLNVLRECLDICTFILYT